MSTIANRDLAVATIEAAQSKKAELSLLLNPGPKSGVAEWFVITGGSNTLHNKAIADAITARMHEEGVRLVHKEGYNEGRWILIDYFDVIINIQVPELREHYNLEKLWGDDCPTEIFELEQID